MSHGLTPPPPSISLQLLYFFQRTSPSSLLAILFIWMLLVTATENTLGWLTQATRICKGNTAVGRWGPWDFFQSLQYVTINWHEPFPFSSFHSAKGRECHYWRGISTPHRLAQDTLTDWSRRKEFDRRLHSYERNRKNDKKPMGRSNSYAMIQARRWVAVCWMIARIITWWQLTNQRQTSSLLLHNFSPGSHKS
jgi:hypothetical protein